MGIVHFILEAKKKRKSTIAIYRLTQLQVPQIREFSSLQFDVVQNYEELLER